MLSGISVAASFHLHVHQLNLCIITQFLLSSIH